MGKLKNIDSADVETRFAWETKLATAKAKLDVYDRTGGEVDAAKMFSTFVQAVKPDEKK